MPPYDGGLYLISFLNFIGYIAVAAVVALVFLSSRKVERRVVGEEERQQIEELQAKLQDLRDAEMRQSRIIEQQRVIASSEERERRAALEALEVEAEAALNTLKKQREEAENQLRSLANQYHSSLALLEQSSPAATLDLSPQDQTDIALLVEKVLPLIQHKDAVAKVIWSEYYAAPVAAMLNSILPQDQSGIYKITNLNSGLCYIGRSVSLRKRLTDHIKSAVGISTIADQAVHAAMRKEGIWNFSFEVVESCDKNELAAKEKYYIAFCDSQVHGYNKNSGG